VTTAIDSSPLLALARLWRVRADPLYHSGHIGWSPNRGKSFGILYINQLPLELTHIFTLWIPRHLFTPRKAGWRAKMNA